MRKFTLCLLTMAFILAFAASASAAELKLGVFNMQDVATKSDAFKEEAKKLESTFSGEKNELEKQQQAMNKQAEDLKNQKGLTNEAMEDRQVEYMRKKRDLDDKTRLFLRRVEIEERKVQQRIAATIVQAVQDYGKRNNYTIIIDAASAGVLYALPSVDVTNDILTETNKVWKTNPPKPAAETAPAKK